MQDLVSGKKGGKDGGGSTYAAQEDPNTLKSIAIAQAIDLVSEGEIAGLVDGLQSVFLDGVPVQNSDGRFNFDGVTIETRNGTPTQTHIRGFDAIRSEIAVDLEVVQATPIYRVVTNQEVDAVVVKVVVPSLTYQDPENGDLKGWETGFGVTRRREGEIFEWIVSVSLTGKTTSEYEHSVRIERPPGPPGTWEFSVFRTHSDSTEAYVSDKTFFSSYTEVIDTRLTYPDCALVGITINAEQFGDKVPKREYDLRGVIVEVPSNYDPETRTYTGIWDGTFQRAWTDNPAWCYYDMLTNKRYGLGEFIDPQSIDRGRLYEISQYCDELVPDGFGGMEPRFTLNVQLRTRDDAYTMVRKLASAFRGITYWGSGTVTPVHDAPADYEFIASPSNVVNGKFTYGSTSVKDTATAALVTYNDPDDGEKASIEVYENADAVSKYGWRQKDIVAFGCNSRGLARRTGKWLVEHDQAERRTVQFNVGLDYFRARPFQIIAVQDPTVAGIRLSGRVVSTYQNTVEVDLLPSDLDLGASYTMTYVTEAGEVQNRSVSVINVANNTVRLTGATANLPKKHSVWMLSSDSIELQLFRIKSVREAQNNTFQISGEEYIPEKYAFIEQDIDFEAPDYTDIPTGPIAAPTSISTHEYLYSSANVVKTAVIASVPNASDPRATLVQWQYRTSFTDSWRNDRVDSEPTFEILDVRDGALLNIRARFISRLGRRSEWVEYVHPVIGKTAPPAAPTNFVASIDRARGVVFTKDKSPDLDYDHTEIFEGATIETARASGEIVTFSGTSGSAENVSPGSYTYWALDFDTGLRESTPVSSSISVVGPSEPTLTAQIVEGNVVISWQDISGSFLIEEYRVYYNDTVIERVNAGSVSIPVTWGGLRTFEVEGIDVVGNVSARPSISVGVTAPLAPEVSVSIHGNRAVLSWTEAVSQLPIRYYRISSQGTVITELTARSYSVEIDFQETRSFLVQAIDSALNLGESGSVSVDITAPLQPVPVATIEGSGIRLSWQDCENTLPIRFYRVFNDENLVAELSALTHFIAVDDVGAINLTVIAYDSVLNESLPGVVEVDINTPAQPTLQSEFEGGNVRISWSDARTTLPIAYYRVLRNGSQVDETRALSFLVPVDWSGDEVFGVIAVDAADNEGTEGSISVNPVSPEAPTVQFSFDGPSVQFIVSRTAGSLPIDKLLIRHNSVVIAEVDTDSWTIPVTWIGQRDFEFLIQDTAKNISAATLVSVTPENPSAPNATFEFVGRNVVLNWGSSRTDLPIDRYVLTNGVSVIELNQTAHTLEIDFVGSRTITIDAYDTAGNQSSTTDILISPVAPSTPVVTTNVIDNSVTFRHFGQSGSLPLQAYEIRLGATYDVNDEALTASANDNFSVYPDLSPGAYTFHANTIDTAGNRSAPVSFGVLVNAIPDYIFLAEWSARALGWPGTMTNCYVTDQSQLVLPVNTSESWTDHFANNSFATVQDQIDAGYEKYLQPSLNSAQYIAEHDYGQIITDSLISVVSTPDVLDGSVAQTISIEYSDDGLSWSTPVVGTQTRGTNFRFVRATIDFDASGGDDLATVSDIIIKLDKKITTDVGRATVSSSDPTGTFIPFNIQFLDTFKPAFRFYGTQNVDVVIDHQDIPNPTGFEVYVFDADTGVRLSGEGSWSVDGFAAIPT